LRINKKIDNHLHLYKNYAILKIYFEKTFSRLAFEKMFDFIRD